MLSQLNWIEQWTSDPKVECSNHSESTIIYIDKPIWSIKIEKEIFSLKKTNECFYIIETRNKNVQQYYAGTKEKQAKHIVELLNKSERPNIDFSSNDELAICFNDHDKNEACEWEYFKLKQDT